MSVGWGVGPGAYGSKQVLAGVEGLRGQLGGRAEVIRINI